MNDKNYSEIEQRLFLLLDTIERQAEQNAQLYEDSKRINNQVEQREKHISELEENQIARLNSFYKRIIDDMGVIENRTLQIQAGVIPAVRQEMQTLNEDLKQTVTDASAELLDKHIGDNVENYDSQVKEAADKIKESGQKIINSANQAKLTLDTTAEQYKEWFAWKALALWGGSILIILCCLVSFYIFMFPSISEIKERRVELATIQQEIDRRDILISNCEGDTCVRVDTKTCKFGVSKWNSNVMFCKTK